MQHILEQISVMGRVDDQEADSFGKKIGVLVRLFGCRHRDISRPFTNGKASYRACLSCGARKKFDTKDLKTSGSFYYPPSVTARP